jgi:hypothetical protein
MAEVSRSIEAVFVDGTDIPVSHKYADRMVVLRCPARPAGDALYFTPDEWEAFVLGVMDTEFDELADAYAPPQEGERVIAMRDSKDPDGPKLYVSVDAWKRLLGEIKNGYWHLTDDMRELLDERFRTPEDSARGN